jgi:choline dehydrogenase
VRTTAAGSTERNDLQYYMLSRYDLRPFPQLMEMAGAPTIIGAMIVGQRPRSRGRVTITSADPTVQPDVQPNRAAAGATTASATTGPLASHGK